MKMIGVKQQVIAAMSRIELFSLQMMVLLLKERQLSLGCVTLPILPEDLLCTAYAKGMSQCLFAPKC